MRLIQDLFWPDLALIRIKMSSETKKSTYFLSCTVGLLNSSIIWTAAARLRACLENILVPGDYSGVGDQGREMGTGGND